MTETQEYLVGVRLREPALADDYKLVGDLPVHVGDIVVVEAPTGTVVGEVRRPRREVPELKRDRLYRRIVGLASEDEAREYRERRAREQAGITTSQALARARGLAMKVVDVEMQPAQRRGSVYFSAWTSATSCAISRGSSGRASRCARSAPATPRACSTASGRAGDSSAARPICGSSTRSR
jgi:hypothetical protein